MGGTDEEFKKELLVHMGRTNATLESIDKQLRANREHRAAHEKRIRALENWRNWLAGAVAVLSAAAAYLLKLVLKKIGMS